MNTGRDLILQVHERVEIGGCISVHQSQGIGREHIRMVSLEEKSAMKVSISVWNSVLVLSVLQL